MSSSSTNVTAKGSSRRVPKSSRGMVPSPAIFPNVITSPGNPPGNQPPVTHTIEQAFNHQRAARDKAKAKKEAHVDIRQRLVQFLAAPASHNDPLRTLSVDQLAALPDDQLLRQALQFLTIDNVHGTLQLPDGSFVSIRSCIDEFAATSANRVCVSINKLLKARLNELQNIATVEHFKNHSDDISTFNDNDLDEFDEDGILDFGDDIPSSLKRQLNTTLAGATVGKKQSRAAGKRQHQPTNRLGVNVAIKDKHVVYATANRSLQDNRRLLMVSGVRSTHSSNAESSAQVFLKDVLSDSLDGDLPAFVDLHESLTPAVNDPQLSSGVGGIHQQNADVASSMSAPPFAVSLGNDGSGGGDDDSSSSYRHSSTNGTEDNHSMSSSGHSDYDNNADSASLLDSDVNLAFLDGHHSDLFENLFQILPVGDSEYRSPGTHSNGLYGPLLFPPCDESSILSALLPHVDDGLFLPQELLDPTFEQRAKLLYLNWNVLHGVDALPDIKLWLESLSKDDHLLLIHLYAAYWVTTPVATLSFGRTKALFWDAVNQAGTFVNRSFVITHDVPLVSVTVESFLVRTVGQWIQFLSRHHLTVADVWDVSLDNVLGFAELDETVHPRYTVIVAALIDLVNFCSKVYRQDKTIEMVLHRQIMSSPATRLNLTPIDANMLLISYFSTVNGVGGLNASLYDVGDLRVSDGLHLLRRAQSFVLSSPTHLQYMSECNERWLHLLAVMFVPASVNVTLLTNEEKISSLLNQRLPSFTNNTLRTTYPTLLQQPSYILKEFLDLNAMALHLYGVTLATDTYGVLRLKLMSCLVAIIQDTGVVENVDNLLSRSDIYYIAHVGGLLRSSQRRFTSDMFVVFDSVDVVTQLASLFNSKMSILISPPPRQPAKLSSAEGWSNKFKSKLSDIAAIDQAARTLTLSINAIVVQSPPFGTVRPQFVRLPRRDDAMVNRASSSDYVRQLASSVRAQYTRMRTHALASALPSQSSSAANRTSSAAFNFPPPQQGARFEFNVQYDEWSEYVEPVAYSLQHQQMITNWHTIRGLQFTGSGQLYVNCLRLFHTSERPIVIGDTIVFLHCPHCEFTPNSPGRTLFAVTHVLYVVVHIRDSVFYFDRVEVLYNYVVMEPLLSKMACPYVGTYILFSQSSDVPRSVASVTGSSSSHQQQSNSNQYRHHSVLPQGRPGSFQQQPSANGSSASRSSDTAPGTQRVATRVPTTVAQPTDSFVPTFDYDSDDSQVKKKTKVSALEWQGQTFYITGKESAFHILRDTFSVRSLMEDGQLQLLVHHVGDFVNNYTADIFKAGILRRNAKSAVLAGMTLTMNANHDLDRFQSLACFDIKEMQDHFYFQKYAFPDAQTTLSLCAEHYLTKLDAIACGFQIASHDFWIRSWKGYQLVVKLLLGPSYGIVIKEIVDEIQQDNIGLYNDVEYLLSLTATMRALLYEYSSSNEVFTLDYDTTTYNPADMTKAQWLAVIRLLWSSFKDKLSFNRQTEYQHARSRYPVARHKPFSGKQVKITGAPVTKMTASAPVAKAPSASARIAVAVTPISKKKSNDKRKAKSPSSSRSSSPASARGRKVEFGVAICISDLAKQYSVKTNLEPCKPDCPYMHYDQLPSNLTSASVLSKVKKIIGKLNLADAQQQQFLRRIETDSKFK